MTWSTRRYYATDPQAMTAGQEWRRSMREAERSRARLAPATGDRGTQTDRDGARAGIRMGLRSPQRLREAFLLREIIGPPRALERVHRWPW